jgi:circadian clock protein KaiC
MTTKHSSNGRSRPVPKTPTGIAGLDEITGGGLPRGRPTLVCGGAGCGKTLLALQFLAQGADRFGEPGIFVSFEETPDEIAANAASIGIDLRRLSARRRLLIDHLHIDRNEIAEAGAYSLDGLFIRLGAAIDAIGAKRVALDTIEMLFAGLENDAIVRAELRRLFTWLKGRGVTAIVTAERGLEGLTRHGLEEFVSDCVILLDHRVTAQSATRRVRVVKYRGSRHATDEFPFVLDDRGITVIPITQLGMTDRVTTRRVSSGVRALDAMLGGKGYYRGSGVLVSGTSGTGKSIVAAHFADAVCAGGSRCLYLAFEEFPGAIIRNMAAAGIDLVQWVRCKRLLIHAARPTAYGLEMHLATMIRLVDDFDPAAVVIDPISNLTITASIGEVKSALLRFMDYLKSRGITFLSTSLTAGGSTAEATDIGISSLMDAWLVLQNRYANGERIRAIQIVKARGTKHSNQVREFVLSDRGMTFVDVARDAEGEVLIGARRSSFQERRAASKGRSR